MKEGVLLCQQLFILSNGRVFEISNHVWSILQNFRQITHTAPEAGGVLLGRHLRDDSAIIVDEVTTPLQGDRQSRCRFYRSQNSHQAIIEHVWHTSEGTCTYLGEWHTHPESIPTPSSIVIEKLAGRLG